MRFLSAFLVLISVVTLRAIEAEALATENAALASGALDQAIALESFAAKTSGDEAKLLKESAKLATEEAENWQKSSDAYEKKQIRLGEKFAEKAKDCADERGKNGLEIAQIVERIKANDPERAQRQAEFERLKAEREKTLPQKP